MTTPSRSDAAIRKLQSTLKGKYDCAPVDRVVHTGSGGVFYTIKACPLFEVCKMIPQDEDVLCCLPDEAVGIDTTREAGDYFGG